MKTLWNSFKVAFAMFSKIPMPRADWTKENMKYMFCFFPWIGAVIGGIFYGLDFLLGKVGYGSSFAGVILLMVPILITGGIHIDGLLDTSDAMSSWQERSRRLEILKDSHAGAFAIITACVYFLLFYSSLTEVHGNHTAAAILSLGFVLSRTMSGFGVLTLPKANASGTVAHFSENSEDRPVKIVLILYACLILACMLLLSPVLGGAAFGTAILVYIYYRHMALKYFGGTTGDLSGFFLCTCETAMAFVLVVLTKL
ncbi:MAG: adenosylcobinamide-GDP ribazoletransferase [Eubacteriales bacterium]|nr:adenosylcobinamide-GDP ribazoletransferase [Eubacteriales bacterium]